MSAYHFISFTVGIQFVVSINLVWKPTRIFDIKGNFSYCTILTKCSVTRHGSPAVMNTWLGQIWPRNEQFGYLSHSNTVSGSVHEHPASHPVNTWSKWYSTLKWDVGITIFIAIVQNKKTKMFHVSGDIQRYLQDFKKVANNAELKHL